MEAGEGPFLLWPSGLVVDCLSEALVVGLEREPSSAVTEEARGLLEVGSARAGGGVTGGGDGVGSLVQPGHKTDRGAAAGAGIPAA